MKKAVRQSNKGSPDISDNQQLLRSAIAWMKIALSNMKHGKKTLSDKGYDHAGVMHAISTTSDVIRELKAQFKKWGSQ